MTLHLSQSPASGGEPSSASIRPSPCLRLGLDDVRLDRSRRRLRIGHPDGSPIHGLADLADEMCRDISVRKRQGWSFGIPGEPNGRFIVKAFTRSTTKPDLYPVVEPTGGFFVSVTISRVLRGRLSPLRLEATYSDEEALRIEEISPTTFFDFDLELAIARTLSAINEDVRLVPRTNRSNCCFCDRRLRDAASKDVGYGPGCARRYQLPHGTKDRALPSKA